MKEKNTVGKQVCMMYMEEWCLPWRNGEELFGASQQVGDVSWYAGICGKE